MIDIACKFLDLTAKVAKAADAGAVRALFKASAAILRTAKASITSGERSAPGAPPKSKRGQLRRAIRFDVDRTRQVAVVGPRESFVGTSATAHEFGGEYKGERYPQRPFMGPALEANLDKLPAAFSAEIHN